MNSLDYAKKCCDTIMRQFPNSRFKWGFHYPTGVFLHGMEEVFLLTNEEKYDKYIFDWLNIYVAPNGFIMGRSDMSVDAIMATNHLIRYAIERDDVPHYKIALKETAEKFLSWKTNKYGGFFHKGQYQNQMWLDSAYMASLYLTRYGLLSGDIRYLAMAEVQMTLIWEHTRDEKTGLMYHVWDAESEAPWADKETGCSPEFWGRAIGWYLATASLLYEILPESPFKARMKEYASLLAESIIRFQDEESGMWYQVIDKGENADNWIETSCSCLFTFGLCKLIRLGVLKDEKYINAAKRAYSSIIQNHIRTDGEDIFVQDVCIGTTVGRYEDYVSRPTKENDLHGTGAFTLMATEYYKTFEKGR